MNFVGPSLLSIRKSAWEIILFEINRDNFDSIRRDKIGNYIDPSDIENWPSGTSEEEKAAIIAKHELMLEELAGTHFYAKNFDLEINGSGKNRIFLGLGSDIISITAVYICNLELPTSWYGWDADSVYLDLCTSGAAAVGVAWGELYYRLGETEERGLFPRGYNNCRFVGTSGQPGLLLLAKQAAQILVEAHNDGSLYPKLMKSERIGDYSYSHGGTSYGNIYTGIREVDDVIEILIRKKPVILTP